MIKNRLIRSRITPAINPVSRHQRRPCQVVLCAEFDELRPCTAARARYRRSCTVCSRSRYSDTLRLGIGALRENSVRLKWQYGDGNARGNTVDLVGPEPGLRITARAQIFIERQIGPGTPLGCAFYALSSNALIPAQL